MLFIVAVIVMDTDPRLLNARLRLRLRRYAKAIALVAAGTVFATAPPCSSLNVREPLSSYLVDRLTVVPGRVHYQTVTTYADSRGEGLHHMRNDIAYVGRNPRERTPYWVLRSPRFQRLSPRSQAK